MTGPLVVLGDALLDIDLLGRVERLCPDAPVPVLQDVVERLRPGGAALAAMLAAGQGREVVLVTPLADDADGEQLRELLTGRVRLIAVPATGATAVKRRIRAAGQSLLRIDSGADRPQVTSVPPAATTVLGGAAAILVSDYGRGAGAVPELRAAVQDAARRIPLVWDPHPRGERPVSNARLVTPNLAEAAAAAARAAGSTGGSAPPASDLGSVRRYADALVEHWQAAAVAVTMGRRGALVSLGAGTPLVVPARDGGRADSCGAGDSFAATAALRLAGGALPTEAVTDAVRAASEFVAAGGAAGWAQAAAPPAPGAQDARQVLARVRAAGGTTVATGGCFDVLHAGHVATLRHARSLGDCLVVCLNSDASVRRAKGPGRPLATVADRASVLLALSCVDAVAIFDEPTPEALLAELRPEVWVKGGDYAATTLPEAELLASWGGQVVAVPFLPGRSSTRLIAHLTDDPVLTNTEEQRA